MKSQLRNDLFSRDGDPVITLLRLWIGLTTTVQHYARSACHGMRSRLCAMVAGTIPDSGCQPLVDALLAYQLPAYRLPRKVGSTMVPGQVLWRWVLLPHVF